MWVRNKTSLLADTIVLLLIFKTSQRPKKSSHTLKLSSIYLKHNVNCSLFEISVYLSQIMHKRNLWFLQPNCVISDVPLAWGSRFEYHVKYIFLFFFSCHCFSLEDFLLLSFNNWTKLESSSLWSLLSAKPCRPRYWRLSIILIRHCLFSFILALCPSLVISRTSPNWGTVTSNVGASRWHFDCWQSLKLF